MLIQKMGLKKGIQLLTVVGMMMAGICLALVNVISVQSQTTTEVDALAWSPNGDRVAVGYQDGSVRIWDADTAQLIHTFHEHTDYVNSIAWNPQGTRLITGSDDWTARIWDVETYVEQSLKILDGFQTLVTAVAWSPNNSKIIVYTFGSRSEYFYDTQDYNLISSHYDGTIAGLVWSPDGSQVALETVGGYAGTVDADSWDFLNTFFNDEVDGGAHYGIYTLAWGQSTYRLAGGTYGGGVVIWDSATADTLMTMRANESQEIGWGTSTVHALRFSENDTRLSGISGDGTFRVWDTLTGQTLGSVQLDEAPIYAAEWSPDGTQIAYGGEGETIQIIPTPSIR